jgi:hypothetical protein
MTDNSTRETFERTVRATWSDSYSFARYSDDHYTDEVLEGMWWAWQINCPQFTALCHSKSKQIGKPVGYLIENEAGGLAAVHNLGRVTWLDDCVAGRVEREDRAQDGGEPVAWMGRHPGRITGFFESEHDAELSFGFEGCTITALCALPLRKHGDGFVKCSEQMPENNENVQVFPILEHSDNEPVHVAFRRSDQWEYIWCGSVYHLSERKITHWRALSYPSVQEQ